jgi:hypothetical protein
MNSRILILALAVIFVVGAAVPALGQTTAMTPSVSQGLSTRALAKARLALLTARSAKSQSRVATRTAGAAVNTANDAKSAATATQASLDSTRIVSGFASGAVTTESETYAQLSGGPSVSVTVPSSGLIEVWAQMTIAGEGAVALFEDGQRMQGQSESCAPEFASSALLASSLEGPSPIALSTPSSVTIAFPEGFFCGVEGPPAGVLFQTSPGHHTYELRYQSGCGCGGGEPPTFSKRLLRVGPRL